MFSIDIQNEKKLQKALRDLGKASRQRTVLKKALNKASTPVNKEAKRQAPTRHKQLRKSIGKVSRTYKPSSVIVVIGPRVGYAFIDDKGYKHNPVKYAHLVEYGHGGPHPAPAHPFLRPAYDNKINEVNRIFNEEAWKNIRKEAERVRNK